MAETNAYLVEYAKSNRSTCSACKNKIDKGELRLGSPIQLGDHLSYKFRHWTCTTPAVLHNMRGKVERHSLGEALHGLEGLMREDQARVQRWLDDGPSEHEEEEEKEEENEGLCLEEREEEEAPVKTPKNRAPRKKRAPSKRAAAKAAEAGEDAADEDYRPAKKAATKKRGAAKRGVET